MNNKYIDTASILVILATLILFIAALFVKGLTHDLLLEVAIFLVSVKLIINAYKNTQATKSINNKLDKIYEKLEQLTDQNPPPDR